MHQHLFLTQDWYKIMTFIDPFKASDKWCRSEYIDLWGIFVKLNMVFIPV